MRIIRGTHGGRQVHPPGNLPVRPTTDLAKESLFNILDNNFFIEDLHVLDLFAGTGSISYEFASRGSQSVLAIDNNGRCIRFISSTAEKLGLETIKSIRTNVFTFLKQTRQQYDIIFADPPYDMEGIEQLPVMIFEKEMLRQDGWLIIEHPGEKDLSGFPQFFDHRKYGRVNFSFFK
jgi:16S rRNA (guanine(966)-N(2))-methyltransferase RsmD